MGVSGGLEWTFDTVVSGYEKMRPGYPNELYSSIFDYCQIDEHSKTIEVGIGAGQATLPVLERGCEVKAIEYGENFSNLCREKYKDFPKFSVITSKFEDAQIEDNSCDLIYSASAFHWVPEEVGYKKVYDALKSGGAFARFANHPYHSKDNPELHKAIDEAYEKYYCTFHNISYEPVTEYTEEKARDRALLAGKYGFRDITYKLFYRVREFSSAEYVELLGTYSDHIVIEESIRLKFFEAIEKAINEHGGVIRLFDTIDLQLARK